ncbi:MAG TPA: MotA/TolQ/ExbB proton channel family protein [Chthoniobacterales bacterium]
MNLFHPSLLAFSLEAAFHLIKQGGFFMVLLIICSVASFAVIGLRAFALRRSSVLPGIIENEIQRLHPGDNPQRLSRLVKGDPSALARIASIALDNIKWPKAENAEAVQTRARHEVFRLESGLVVLEIVVGIAPLLGLLGAVAGLVSVFSNIGSGATSTGDLSGIASGISEALSTTIVGLGIAIPSLAAHSYFSRKIENMAVEMESIVTELIGKCYSQKARLGAIEPRREDVVVDESAA